MANFNIQILKGNIVNADVQVIVNSANNSMTPGEGVNRMIFYTGGDKLVEACAQSGRLSTGKAVLTPGFALSMPYVIHTAAPYWHGGYDNEAKKLASCYIECMKIAEQHNFESIAFPSLSTGYGRYPLKEAAQIAVETVRSYIINHNMDIEVNFLCFDEETLLYYRELNMTETIDISRYLKRGEFDVDKKLNKDEKNIVRKKLFKKVITQDQLEKAALSVLKRIAKKRGLIMVSPKVVMSQINDDFCLKRGDKTGPFVNMSCVSNISLEGDNIKFHVAPFSYKREEKNAEKLEQILTQNAEFERNKEDASKTTNVEQLLAEIGDFDDE